MHVRPIILVVAFTAGCGSDVQPIPGSRQSDHPTTTIAGKIATPDENVDWVRPAKDLSSTRFSALDQITSETVKQHVEYTWWAQRRGFLRNTLQARLCDVVMGLPASIEAARATRPYYRSSYMFVTRHARRLDVTSFDDRRLRHLRIGVPLVGDDGANAPPALARRGATRRSRRA